MGVINFLNDASSLSPTFPLFFSLKNYTFLYRDEGEGLISRSAIFSS